MTALWQSLVTWLQPPAIDMPSLAIGFIIGLVFSLWLWFIAGVGHD